MQGYFTYYAVPGSCDSLALFRQRLLGLWSLRRRSQKVGDNLSPRTGFTSQQAADARARVVPGICGGNIPVVTGSESIIQNSFDLHSTPFDVQEFLRFCDEVEN